MKSLEELYQEMADMTKPECGKCNLPHSCCDEMYCDIAEKTAAERGITLKRLNNHPNKPFFLDKDNNCIVPPHLRSMCTFHTCKINNMGTSGDPEWDEKYFKLREEIDNLEYERQFKKHPLELCE